MVTTGTPEALNCSISPAVPNELVRTVIAVPPAFDAKIPLPVNDDNPVPPWATAKSVVSVKLAALAAPVTVSISSIVVVPPAESIVRLPDDVSISLSPVIPTWTLPKYAPPNCAHLIHILLQTLRLDAVYLIDG